MKNTVFGLLFNLFDNFNHDESWTNVFVLFFFQIHKLSQCHLSFVFWWFLAFSWRWTLSWRGVILSAFYAAWTDILSFDSWLIGFNSCEFSMLRWISLSGNSFTTFNNLTCFFNSWSKDRSSVSCADHLWLLLLENFQLFLMCLQFNF